MNTFQTTAPYFIAILLAYLALCLLLGAKGVYFEPYRGEEEEKQPAHK